MEPTMTQIDQKLGECVKGIEHMEKSIDALGVSLKEMDGRFEEKIDAQALALNSLATKVAIYAGIAVFLAAIIVPLFASVIWFKVLNEDVKGDITTYFLSTNSVIL